MSADSVSTVILFQLRIRKLKLGRIDEAKAMAFMEATDYERIQIGS